jgi:hypothetical protein
VVASATEGGVVQRDIRLFSSLRKH